MTVDEALALVLTVDDGGIYDALCYGRRSSELQVDNYSMPEQKRACVEIALKHGARPERILWLEDTWPGELVDRPQLALVRTIHEQRRTSRTVMLDPDRLTRASVGLSRIIYDELLKTASVHFVSGDYANTAEGRMFFNMKAMLSEYYKEQFRNNSQRGKRGKAREGSPPGYVRTYGYAFDFDGTDHRAIPEEADVVVRVFEMRRDRMAYQSIAAALNAEGIPTTRNTKWWPVTIKQILENETYLGTLWANKLDTTRMGLNKYVDPAERVRVKVRPRSEWIGIPVPRIIPDELWLAVHGALPGAEEDDSGVRASRGARFQALHHTYYLSQLLYCGHCGWAVIGTSYRSTKGSKKRYHYYLCGSSCARKSGVTSCEAKRVRADALEELVWAKVVAYLEDPYAQVANPADEMQTQEEKGDADSLASIEEQLAKVARDRAQVVRWRLNERLSESEADEQLDELKEKERRLQKLRDGLAAQEAQRNHIRAQLQEAEQMIAAYSGRLADFPVEQRPALYRTIIERIILQDSHATIVWRAKARISV